MKAQWVLGFILVGALATGVAQQGTEHGRMSGSTENAGDAVLMRAASVSVPGRRTDSGAMTLSSEFTTAALSAAFQMQSTERRVEQSIKRGFPLGEFWIENDLDQVDDSLRLAALNVRNDADLEALSRLELQSSRLRLWSDWLLEENRNLRLAEYYMSSAALDNDDRFQSTVACTRSLVSMLSSRKLTENNACQ